MSEESFVSWFRSTAPYIHAHRGRTFVIVFGGEVVESDGLRDVVHDLALLHSLGVRVVVVVGARPQIERRLRKRRRKSRYVHGLRVTDDVALECVKEAAATVRLEMEALLSMGLPGSPMAGARLRVATGNFVVARPVGVIDGVDLLHTGEVRRIDSDAISERLDAGSVVLLTPIGYSLTGEVFNVSTHDVACATAMALRADKLVALTEAPVREGRGEAAGEEMDPDGAELLLRRHDEGSDVHRHLEAAVAACRGGVRRAHLVSRHVDGALLRELYTREGIGVLVSEERFEGARKARLSDVAGITVLIEPLERDGHLTRRTRDTLERDIDRFSVIERDGLIIACAALYVHRRSRSAEVACVAVHPDYRSRARGDALLQFVERQARGQGVSRLFVLTTRTAHWFRERGFEPGSQRDVPTARKREMSPGRNSKVLVKRL